MRLLYVADRFHPLKGGGENYVLNLAARMADKGHRVTVFTSQLPHTPRREVKDGVEIQRFPTVLSIHGQPLTAFPSSIVTNDVDVLHASGPCLNEDVLLPTLRLWDTPVVVTYHADFILQGPLVEVYYRLKARVPYAFADRVIVTTGRYAQTLKDRGLSKEKLRVIPLGVDKDVFRPADEAERQRLREKYELSGEVLLFVGAMDRRHRYKHPELLLRAVKDLLNKRRTLRLVMVGGGEWVGHYQAYSKELGVAENVRFTGPQPNPVVAELYRVADVLVLPSPTPSEGFGTVLLEAMASRCPVVCTSACGGSQIVEVEGAGIVVTPWNPSSMAEAVDRLLADEYWAQALAENGRRAVEARYNLDAVAEKTLQVYQEVRR